MTWDNLAVAHRARPGRLDAADRPVCETFTLPVCDDGQHLRCLPLPRA